MKYYWQYQSPVGAVNIAEEGGCLTGLYFSAEEDGRLAGPDFSEEDGRLAGSRFPDKKISEKNNRLTGFEKRETTLIKKAKKQLDEYFAGKRKAFDLPLFFNGTAFQKQVWEALLTIPYGETRTYGQVAAQIGNPKASRAVGMANNRNPIAIICPCHRVIGAGGSLVGYGGGLENKRLLLDLETTHKK